MYAGRFPFTHPERPAFIMAATGEAVTYAALETRSNQLAHWLRREGLKRLDHYALFMENNNRYLESCAAGERAGLYYTCINSYLKADELAYILNNSESKVLITSISRLAVAVQALTQCPNIKRVLVVQDAAAQADEPQLLTGIFQDFEAAVATMPGSVISDESLGTSMLYSGHHWSPKRHSAAIA
jgi:long-chain acyl-CoA synthetase